VERLSVFKALGDNTRYAIYLELARSEEPLTTTEIAETLDLHPNTVRPHLERMRDVGLLEVDTVGQGQVGRPQHRYSLAPDAPSLGLEPAPFRLLARLMAEVVAAAKLDSDEAAAVGRRHGKSMVGKSCAPAEVSAALAGLGFDPAMATDGSTVTLAFTRCPFQELAEMYPEVVCHLHRGIVEGMAAGKVSRFATLLDRDPCEVDLVSG
jgi:predicted ArsR family transcriptional regulator